MGTRPLVRPGAEGNPVTETFPSFPSEVNDEVLRIARAPAVRLWKFHALDPGTQFLVGMTPVPVVRVALVAADVPGEARAMAEDYAAAQGLDPRWLATTTPKEPTESVLLWAAEPKVLHTAGRYDPNGFLWRWHIPRGRQSPHPKIGGLSADAFIAFATGQSAERASEHVRRFAAKHGFPTWPHECAEPLPIALRPGLLAWVES